jgi:hypothetical protein
MALLFLKFFFSFFFSFHIMRQVFAGLPQGVGGLAIPFYTILLYLYDTHQVLVGLPQGDGGIVLSFDLFCLYFILVYFSLFSYHAPGARRPPPRGWYFILFCVSVILQHAPGARRAPPRGWWPCSYISFVLFVFHFSLFSFNYITRTRCS